MATLNPISQRIALEGAQEIAKQLADLGIKGDAAFKQIAAAAQAATTQLSPFQQRLQAVGASFTQFGARVSAVAATIGTVRLGNLSQEFNNLGTAAGTFGRRALTITAALTAAAVATGLFVKSAAQAADDAEDNADALGLSIAGYQGLTFAAASAGVAQEKFSTSLRILSKGVSEAAETQGNAIDAFERRFGIVNAGLLAQFGLIGREADGARERLANFGLRAVGVGEQFDQLRARMVATGVRFSELGKNIVNSDKGLSDAGKSIQRLGVNVRNLSTGELRPLEDIIGDLAEAFSKLGRGPQTTALALQIFGRSGSAMLPLLLKGRAGVDELTESFKALGIGVTDVDARIGEENVAAFTRLSFILDGLKTKIGLVFAPALTSVINAITNAINRNQLALRDFATTLGERIKPVVADIVAVLSGKAPTEGGFVDGLIKSFNRIVPTITGVIEQIRSAFNTIIAVFDSVAAKINAVFGTNLTGGELAIIAVVAQLTGALSLLAAAATLAAAVLVTVKTAFAALAAPIGFVLRGIALIVGAIVTAVATITGLPIAAAAAIVAGVALAVGAIFIFRDDIIAAFQALPGLIQSAVSGLTEILLAPFRLAADGIRAILNPIADIVRRILDGIGSIRLPQASEGGGGSGFARGGRVFGPGTSTSDSIFARLSRGEFVIRAAAVEHFGPSFFAALNNLRLPQFSIGGLAEGLARSFDSVMPLPRFADGGLAMAGPGVSGRPLLIPLGDGGPPVRTTVTRSQGKRLEREAVRRRILSAGTKWNV